MKKTIYTLLCIAILSACTKEQPTTKEPVNVRFEVSTAAPMWLTYNTATSDIDTLVNGTFSYSYTEPMRHTPELVSCMLHVTTNANAELSIYANGVEKLHSEYLQGTNNNPNTYVGGSIVLE